MCIIVVILGPEEKLRFIPTIFFLETELHTPVRVKRKKICFFIRLETPEKSAKLLSAGQGFAAY